MSTEKCRFISPKPQSREASGELIIGRFYFLALTISLAVRVLRRGINIGVFSCQVLINGKTAEVRTGPKMQGKRTRHNWPTEASNALVKRTSFGVLLCAFVVSLSALGQQRTDCRPQSASDKPIETTISALVKKNAIFSGKRVRVSASFHSDGIERSVLMEPNCGPLDATSKTPPPGEPQCYRGIVPTESDKAENDPGNQDLDRALPRANVARGTSTSLPNSLVYSAAFPHAHRQNTSLSNSSE